MPYSHQSVTRSTRSPSCGKQFWTCARARPAGALTAIEPPNAPLEVSLQAGRLVLFYGGRPILEGTIGGEGVTAELRTLTDTAGGRVTHAAVAPPASPPPRSRGS